MDDASLGRELLRGGVLGLAIAAPVGPIGILCIKRTLAQGWPVGLATGLGAATADGIYGCVAGLGLTAIAGFLVAQQTGLKLFGGLFLLYLGVQTLRRQPPARDSGEPETAAGAASARSLAMAYGSTLGLTLTNPATILSFVAILSGFGLAETARSQAISLMVGIFCGSALWWLLLSGLTHHLRRRLPAQFLRWINGASGLILIAFGSLALLSSLSARLPGQG